MSAAAPPTLVGAIGSSDDLLQAKASILSDGRVNIHLKERAAALAQYLDKTPRYPQGRYRIGENLASKNRKWEASVKSVLRKFADIPRLNIAIHIVGSRGDVQPFIAIAQQLIKEPYNHRVRICTHPVFKDFVEENGLEFFSIGGDPAKLMAYMVKNPGLMPGIESLRQGDVTAQRKAIAEMIEGCWRGCVEPGNGMSTSSGASKDMSRDEETESLFIADAIIANPPSYAHIHCAEKLGIPLHMMFT